MDFIKKKGMNMCKRFILFSAVLCASGFAAWAGPDMWDDRKAKDWNEGYPIGNGQLGAMVFASPDQVRLQFNHSRLWTGKPHAYERPNAVKALPRIRQLVRERKSKEAIQLANREFVANPVKEAKYQPFGDLVIKPRKPSPTAPFRRGLVFRDGMHVYDDGFLVCETFAPYDRPGIIVHHLTTKEPLEFEVALSFPHQNAQVAADGRQFSGRLPGDGISYAAEIRLVRENDRTLTVYLAAATDVVSPWKLGGDYRGEVVASLADAERAGYAKIRSSHLAAWRKLYDRVELQLEGKPGLAQLSTRERLARQPVEKDPAFVKLNFDYGRYLLIAANRPDRSGEATTLQGLWNDQLNPPWECSMTININTQMNYWPAEVCGLGECHLPLMRLLDEIAVSGAKTARTLYGAGGWMAHHNIDLWRGTCPFDDAYWGTWQAGGAWLATHIWEHYRFGGDREFLRQMWPTLRGSAEFFTDALVEYGGRASTAHGQLVTNPSMSPEHGGLREGPAIDMQIVRYIYKAVLAAAKELGQESDPLLAKIREQLPRLAPSRIGRWGQLQEWVEDEDDPKNQFGHISHLWAIYPGDEITPETPELFAAAKKSLTARGNTDIGSWPACWRICEWARFHDGSKAADIINSYLRPQVGNGPFGMHANLFTWRTFQIDATFGLTAGIAEMLVQSHRFDKNGKPLVELLPALPPDWKNGSVRGLRVRGGGEVSFTWRDGKIVSQKISTGVENAAKK